MQFIDKTWTQTKGKPSHTFTFTYIFVCRLLWWQGQEFRKEAVKFEFESFQNFANCVDIYLTISSRLPWEQNLENRTNKGNCYIEKDSGDHCELKSSLKHSIVFRKKIMAVLKSGAVKVHLAMRALQVQQHNLSGPMKTFKQVQLCNGTSHLDFLWSFPQARRTSRSKRFVIMKASLLRFSFVVLKTFSFNNFVDDKHKNVTCRENEGVLI